MSKHTPGPWAQEAPHGLLVIDGTGYLVADCARPEDAHRIVACVNACAGISDEQLESWASMSRLILQSMKELKAEADREAKQRDELLEALRHLAHNAKKSGANMGLALDVARAAIAKATGDE